MLNCNVVKDILPNYTDGLLSEETAQEVKEHLTSCADCNAVYEEMRDSLTPIAVADAGEIDYLKKFKTKSKANTIKYSVISALAVVVIFIVCVFIFHIGKPVNSEDLSYTLHKLSDSSIQIDMKLENGLVLEARPEMIFDNDISSTSIEQITVCTPRQTLKIPFDDRGEDGGSGFTWGYEVSGGEISDEFTFIFRFADKDVVLTIDDFQDK